MTLLLLLACSIISSKEFDARQDFDGDGFMGTQYGGDDCADADGAVNPGVPEVCDGVDNDCDGITDNDDAVDAATWYADADGDGYGGGAVTACQRPEGYVPNADDCNDDNAAVNPGVTDVWYDGEDSDCGGNSDLDKDGDGFDSDAYGGTDCNDEDAAINPGATEIWYDTVDQDCNTESDFDQDSDGYDSLDWGGQDCDDEDGSVHPDATDAWYDGIDSNCDGFDDFDQDGDGHGNTGSGGDDCDDGNDTIYAGATEHCDAVDQDCDGESQDSESDDAQTYYADADGDLYGDAGTPQDACSQPDGYVSDAQDCDDTTPSVTYITWYADSDGDNYGNALSSTNSCTKPVGYVADATDCDDLAAGSNPGEIEVCDAGDVDEDCDGVADDDDGSATGQGTYYGDRDGDGFGDVTDVAVVCDPGSRYIVDATDCDDGDSSVRPTAAERCDAADVDEDCDGLSDDDDPNVTGQTSYYTDADHDGYGAGTAALSCELIAARVTNYLDCNDTNASVSPATGGCDISLADADAKLTGDGAAAYAGEYLAAAGDVNADGYADFLVGAPGTSLSSSSSYEGEAYVMYGPVGGGTSSLLAATADIYGVRNSHAGAGVVGFGDLDGDGYDDIGVGVSSPREVAVFLGPLTGGYSTASADGSVTMTSYSTLAGAGDFDGDGAPDLLVGSEADDTSGTNAGAAFVISVPTSGVVDLASSSLSLYGEAANDQAGGAIAGDADFDADGYSDILIGAQYYDADGTGMDEGAAYFVYGPVTGSLGLADADVKLVGDLSDGQSWSGALVYTGCSVANAGDVNNDGYDDALIGASGAGQNRNGRAYLALGPMPASGLVHDVDAQIDYGGDNSAFGKSVAGAGDVNDDGYADILINAEDTGSSGYTYLGYSYVFLGPISGSIDDGDANGTLVGETNYDGQNNIVSGAGDVDADGSDDMLIGVWAESSAASYAGAVYLVLGSNF